jgi:hypothetical protein
MLTAQAGTEFLIYVPVRKAAPIFPRFSLPAIFWFS